MAIFTFCSFQSAADPDTDEKQTVLVATKRVELPPFWTCFVLLVNPLFALASSASSSHGSQ
jgi:hypothetical protein